MSWDYIVTVPEFIISKQNAEKRPEPSVDCIQRASMANCDLAISLMHKLEMALNALGG